MTTHHAVWADPDEIELHARDLDRMCAQLSESLPAGLTLDTPGPGGTELYWTEEPGELPHWEQLCRAATDNEAAVIAAYRLLLEQFETTAARLHQVARDLQSAETTAETRLRRLRRLEEGA